MHQQNELFNKWWWVYIRISFFLFDFSSFIFFFVKELINYRQRAITQNEHEMNLTLFSFYDFLMALHILPFTLNSCHSRIAQQCSMTTWLFCRWILRQVSISITAITQFSKIFRFVSLVSWMFLSCSPFKLYVVFFCCSCFVLFVCCLFGVFHYDVDISSGINVLGLQVYLRTC